MFYAQGPLASSRQGILKLYALRHRPKPPRLRVSPYFGPKKLFFDCLAFATIYKLLYSFVQAVLLGGARCGAFWEGEHRENNKVSEYMRVELLFHLLVKHLSTPYCFTTGSIRSTKDGAP